MNEEVVDFKLLDHELRHDGLRHLDADRKGGVAPIETLDSADSEAHVGVRASGVRGRRFEHEGLPAMLDLEYLRASPDVVGEPGMGQADAIAVFGLKMSEREGHRRAGDFGISRGARGGSR